jgi:hypothetical protein
MEEQVNSLGPYYSEYKTNTVKTNNIAFKPDISSGFYSAFAIPSKNKVSDVSDSELSLINEDSDSESESESETGIESKEKPFYSVGNNPINNIFIGSVTVLGLFLLYRLLQKGK